MRTGQPQVSPSPEPELAVNQDPASANLDCAAVTPAPARPCFTPATGQLSLVQQLQQQVQRLDLLNRINATIHRSLDLATVLQTIVTEVRQFLQTDRAVIYQFEADWQGQVVVEAVEGTWQPVLGTIGRDDCFSGEYAHLYLAGRVRAIDNVATSTLGDCHIRFLQRLQVQANLIVPILVGDGSPDASHNRLWGLLIAHECRGPRHWLPCEMEFLQQLAAQAAIAIQQAELYTQVQRQAEQAQRQAEQLQAALTELKSTQAQLIQSEKLSSLGQMVAGIAHEINNANTFVHANLPYASRYFEVFSRLVDRYETVGLTLPVAERQALVHGIAEILELPEAETASPPELVDLVAAELDYIRQDCAQLMRSMEEGSRRIREIVLSLRNFSRLDEAGYKVVDLHQGLDSTLLILQHRLQQGIRLVKEYQSLPQVGCYAGQINQVFLNLLNNAIDAVTLPHEAATPPPAAVITIRTWQPDPDWVVIAIADTGPGIPLPVQARMFDPFFTTKAVGQGRGLGLAIARQIIVNGHGGELRCISEPGQGTEFQVWLPVRSEHLTR
ncbi:ATP-binding protein [Trichothermofontia sichuanensis B231]|uniref:GAF domain-containing sensor histidine kinase n=1 Tax=Trichothermofontia sichuanensis TaxID=3045816 RepID=UPI002246EEF2|nr:ATP-binding protein [Trichothermofontia sichuanensis]UZQ53960.1 ATP-binding protein [Trichothermofontia sichuanensis B231]